MCLRVPQTSRACLCLSVCLFLSSPHQLCQEKVGLAPASLEWRCPWKHMAGRCSEPSVCRAGSPGPLCGLRHAFLRSGRPCPPGHFPLGAGFCLEKSHRIFILSRTNGRGKTPLSSVTSHMVLSLLTPMFGLRRVFRKHTRHCVCFSLSLVILSPSMSASRLTSLPWLRNTPCRLRGWAW